MSAAVQRTPMKRVLTEATNARGNILASPRSAKKPKLDSAFNKNFGTPRKGAKGSVNSSQPKSQFEEEVLEKLTQDIHGLKQNNSERDQQWQRPSIDDFNETKDSLCFQQIEAEEGALNGGKTTIKLFGVTEVRHSIVKADHGANRLLY